MSKTLTALALGLAVFTSAARADDVVNEHKKALGKPEAIAKIKTIRRTGDVEFNGQFSGKGTIEDYAVLGKKSVEKVKSDTFESTEVWTGEKGWSNMFGSVNEMNEEQLGKMKGIAAINPFLGIASELPAEKLTAGADVEFNGVACKTYKAEGDMTIYIGKSDHLFHGMAVKAKDPAGGDDIDIKVTYSDFKEYEGVKFADKVVTDVADGNVIITTKFTKTEINPELPDSLFAKP